MRLTDFPRITVLGIMVVLALGLAVSGAPARAAGPADEAEALIRKSNDLRSAGDDQGALALVQRAAQLHPSPRTYAQLGLVENALGRWADSDQHLTEALKGSNDPWIKKNVVVLEDTLTKVKLNVARVEITGEPDGAEVLVNGRPVGKVPLSQPVRVNAGSVDVELRAPGYKRALRTLTVTGLQYQPVVIRLEPEGTPTAGGSRTESGMMPVGLGATGPDADSGDSNWRPWAVGGALGGAALGIGAGVLGIAQHNADVNAFNRTQCFEMGGVITRDGPNGDIGPCKKLRTSYQNARTLSIVGFSAGAALGITALVLYLTAPESAEGPRTAQATCAPDLARPGLACALRF